MATVLLLSVANIFMTFAWYGHLRHRDTVLWKVILVSWGIAFIEYLFQVPANRIGANQGWTGFQLKIAQEAITLVVFTVFAWVYLKERLSWNNALAFAMILGAVALTFAGRGGQEKSEAPAEVSRVREEEQATASRH